MLSHSFSFLTLSVFLAQLVFSQTPCEIGTEGVCADDVEYLRCRIQEELHALELFVNSSLTPPPNQPLFNDAGRQQCEAFVERGFCISQPTEMSAYCCQSFVSLCNSQNATLPQPPSENTIFLDDEDDAFMELSPSPTTIISTATPTSNTVTTTAGTNALLTRSLVSPTVMNVCDFVDAAAVVGNVVRKELMKNFSFLLNDMGPVISRDASPRLVSEDIAGIDVDFNALYPHGSFANRRPRHRRRISENLVMFDPPAEWNVNPAVFHRSSRASHPSLFEKSNKVSTKRAKRRGRSLQEEIASSETSTISPESASTIEMNNLRVETTPEVPLSQSDQVVLGILSLFGPGSGNLLSSLVPGVNFTEFNYTMVESDLIIYGNETASRLDECYECLQQLVDTALEGAFQIQITPNLPAAQKRRIVKKNEQALIKTTSSEFAERLVKFIHRFTAELKIIYDEWLVTRIEDNDISLDEFMTHAGSALKTVLKEDDLGGLMNNFLSVVGIVFKNMQSPLKAETIKKQGNKIYTEVLKCSGELSYTNDSISSNDGRSGSLGEALTDDENQSTIPPDETRQLMTVEGLVGEGLLLDSWKQERLKQEGAAGLRHDEFAYRLLQEEADQAGFDVNSPKDLNFISDLTSNATTSETDGIEEATRDGWLQGQPCLDRPIEFIASLHRLYGDLDCNDLISAVGCEPERFILSINTLVEACKSTWNIRCTTESITLDREIIDILRSQCYEIPKTNITITTTTSPVHSTTTSSLADNKNSPSISVCMSLVFVLHQFSR